MDGILKKLDDKKYEYEVERCQICMLDGHHKIDNGYTIFTKKYGKGSMMNAIFFLFEISKKVGENLTKNGITSIIY